VAASHESSPEARNTIPPRGASAPSLAEPANRRSALSAFGPSSSQVRASVGSKAPVDLRGALSAQLRCGTWDQVMLVLAAKQDIVTGTTPAISDQVLHRLR
jgi:hypothetical protein